MLLTTFELYKGNFRVEFENKMISTQNQKMKNLC